MERFRPRNLRNVLAIAGLALSGCVSKAGETPVPRVEPTETTVPSATPTATATEVPTVTATPTVEPAPTQVPEYIGLPAAEVAALRQECLKQNPDSLCLPLPFAPSTDAPIEVVFENYEDPGFTIEDGVKGQRFLSLAVPAGTDLLAPLSGDVWIRGSISGYGEPRWLDRPGRTIEGISSVSFGWGPFVAYNGYSEASTALVLVKGEECGDILYGGRKGRTLFQEGDLAIPAVNQVTTGEILVQVKTQMCLQIHDLESLYFSIPFPDGSGIASGDFAFSRTELSDLLRTEAGSIVYLAP